MCVTEQNFSPHLYIKKTDEHIVSVIGLWVTTGEKNRRPRYAHLGNNYIRTLSMTHFDFTTLGGPGFFCMPPVWSQKKRQTMYNSNGIVGHFYGHI